MLACFAAFIVTQRLKHTPTAVQRFQLTPIFSPTPSGHIKEELISFKLAHAEEVTVTITDSAGRTVATLVRDRPVARYKQFSLRWNGREGTAYIHTVVTGGAFTYRIHAGQAMIYILGAIAAAAIVSALMLVMRRWPDAFPLLAIFALPFRLPISTDGRTVNLLIPLYLVIAAGTLGQLAPRWLSRRSPETPRRRPIPLEWLLLGAVVLYAVQGSHQGRRERRVLLHPVWTAVHVAARRALYARARAGVPRRGGRAGDRVRGGRVCRVLPQDVVPQPEGGRGEPVRQLLSRQLTVF